MITGVPKLHTGFLIYKTPKHTRVIEVRKKFIFYLFVFLIYAFYLVIENAFNNKLNYLLL